jgi:hypothetical protein
MSIVGRNYLFGFDGGLMDSAVREVGDLIRVKEELAGTAGMPVSVDAPAYPLCTAYASPPVLILPTNPPPPSMRSFPLQEVARGSHTSELISESVAGRRVKETRQYVSVCVAAVTLSKCNISAQDAWVFTAMTVCEGAFRLSANIIIKAGMATTRLQSCVRVNFKRHLSLLLLSM